MRLLPFLLAGIGAFALCHYFWIPALERRMKAAAEANLKAGAVLSFAGFLRGLLLIAVLTTASIIVIVTILQALGGNSYDHLAFAINTIRNWRGWLIGFGPVWGATVIVLLVIALGIYARRKGRQRIEGAFERVFDREIKRLEQEQQQGQWEDLPPTREMEEMNARIMEADQLLRELNRNRSVDAETESVKQKLTSHIQMLMTYTRMLDIQRRIKLKLDPEDVALPAPRTRWEKVQAFLMSRGLVASLGAGSRILFLAGFILLVPSLVSVYAVSTEKILDERLVKLQELFVDLQARDLDKAKNQLGEPAAELAEEDKELLQEVARAFEAATPMPAFSSSTRAGWYTMRSSTVRGEVLTRAVRRSPTPWQQHGSGSKIGDLSPLERGTVAVSEETVRARGPITEAGGNVYTELEDIARRDSSFVKRLRTELRSFQSPASIYDIRRMMVNHIIGSVSGSGELGNLAQSMNLKVNQASYNLSQKGRAYRFISDLMGGSDFSSALGNVSSPSAQGFRGVSSDFAEYQNVMRAVEERLPVDQINTKVGDHPPSIDVLPEKHVNLPTAAAKVEQLTQQSRGPLRDTSVLADSLAQYQDHFPGQVEVDSHTERGKIISRLNNEGLDPPPITSTRPKPPAPKPPPVNLGASRGSFLRARSFSALRGFSRVGGVLIGRNPSDAGETRLDCTDIEWEVEGRSVRLILTTADGKKFRSRLHPMSLVYQAINYAADGRPLAVTMATAKPLLELKILLHPTLVDTPLGHRVIELDRFVDIYARDDKVSRKAETRVEAQMALYKYAWAYRLLAALPENDEELEIRDYLTRIIQSNDLKMLVALALSEPDLLADTNHSPLTVKKEFFDSTLISVIQSNAWKGRAPEEFGRAIYEDSQRKMRRASINEGSLKTQIEQWIQPPPSFELWSGVREKNFSSNPAEILMLDGAATIMPFDFMLQVAFTSPPAFGESAQSESYNDSQPWEFPSIGAFIQNRVLTEIPKNAKSRAILEDVSEFALLQRMFRMAFDGHLGMDFPVEKLLLLSENRIGKRS